jgi:hypothetical protein
MKTAFWQASLTASQAGENSQTNGLEHTIKSSILTDLILRKPQGKNDSARNILKPAKKPSSTNASQNSNRHNNGINFNINFDLEFSKIKDGTNVQNSKNPLLKVLSKKSMKQNLTDCIKFAC